MWKKNSFRNYIYYSLFHGAKMLSVQETCLGARIFLASKCKYWKGAITYVLWCQKYQLFFFSIKPFLSQEKKKKKNLLIAPPIKGFQGIKNKECNANVLSHFSRVQLCATSMDCTRQAPLSMGFSRQEYRSWLPFPSPRDLPDRGSVSPAIAS